MAHLSICSGSRLQWHQPANWTPALPLPYFVGSLLDRATLMPATYLSCRAALHANPSPYLVLSRSGRILPPKGPWSTLLGTFGG
ncbi:unnamed protein product [Protopolystoma xenopodis]|uniref:Uncharacterized protein n=1 Tax=Protopolystoma xenopodis TaxID=117903 RepID=A0A3S5BRA2_9PLAT|nr:unnamed protein product [Protopolystoma xenopodis]